MFLFLSSTVLFGLARASSITHDNQQQAVLIGYNGDVIPAPYMRRNLDLHAASSGPHRDGFIQPATSALVVIRTHNPAPGALLRMSSMAADLKSNSINPIVMASWDDTKLTQQSEEQVLRSLQNTGAFLHKTSLTDVFENYPIMKSLAYVPNGYNQHIEFLLSAVEGARKQGVNLPDTGYVWMLEDDVGICGKISELVASYDDDPSDFIGTRPIIHVTEDPKELDWPNADKASIEFLKRYPVRDRYKTAEHIERFSVKFLQHLDNLIRHENVTGWSEMFPATICMHSPEFSCTNIRDENRFSPQEKFFDFYTHVDEATWSEICPDSNASPPKCAHALKW